MKYNTYLVPVVAIYLAIGLFLLQYIGFYTDSPDTIFYLTISKKYATGQFYSAINNYWSPLVSWLLVPFLWGKCDPLISFKILQLSLGGISLILTVVLSHYLLKNSRVKNFFTWSLIPVFISYALLYQTPDLLFLCILLFLILQFIHLLKDTYNTSHIRSIGLGLTGAALYFAKSFGFPLFLASVLLVFIFIYKQTSDKKERQLLFLFTFKTVLVFFVMALSWMYCLKLKYGIYTTGYASVYNFNLLHPDIYKPGLTNLQHPVLTNGLMDVSSREEASAWESPGNSHQRTWSPFDNAIAFQHYLSILRSNADSFYYFMIKRNIGILFFISILFYFILIRNPVSKISLPAQFLTSLMLAFIGGYALVFFIPRYLWFCVLLMPLISFYLLEIIVMEKQKWKLAYQVFALFMLALLVKKPVKEILFRSDSDMTVKEISTGILNLKPTLTNSYSQSMALPALIEKIKLLNLPKGKVAGISSSKPGHFSYTQSLLLGMYLDQTFYGELQENMADNEKLRQLQNFGIDYIYCWETPKKVLPGTEILLDNPQNGLKIFKMMY